MQPSKSVKRNTGVRRPSPFWALIALGALLLGVVVLAVAHGSVSLPPVVVGKVVLNQLGLTRFPATWGEEATTIILTLRLPRAIGAALVGAALATAGALFQGLLRNPLAEPYVVGASGGAALGAVIGILGGSAIQWLGFGLVPLGAFVGAVSATLLVVQLATVGGRLPVVTVLLAGFAVSTLLAYTASFLMVIGDQLQVHMPQLYAWLLGGISVVGWSRLQIVGPLIGLVLLATLPLGRSLNAFSLGEDGAARLGVPVEQHKRLILLFGSLLTAAAVSVSGMIGFVGLIVPHMMRLCCGPDHRLLLPASALGGGIFLVLADLLARLLLPAVHASAAAGELPVGIVTALLGGPFFLWLLRRSRREYQW